MTKRKLPVLQNASAEPEEPPRPPWHWIGFGAVAVFAAWLPLASLAEWVKSRVVARFLGPVSDAEGAASALAGLTASDRSRLAVWMVALPATALFAGAMAGGYLVGRYGDGARVSHGALAGALAALVAAALAAMSLGLGTDVLVAVGVAVPFAALASALGARYGLRRRRLAGVPQGPA